MPEITESFFLFYLRSSLTASGYPETKHLETVLILNKGFENTINGFEGLALLSGKMCY